MGIDTQDDEELTALRALLQDHGALPDVPDELLGDGDETERLLRDILATPAGTSRPAHRAVSSARASRPRQRGSSRPVRAGGRRAGLAAVAAAALVVALVSTQSTLPAPATAATLPSLHYTLADPAETTAADLPDASDTLRELATSARLAPPPARDGRVQHIVTQEWLSETTATDTGQSTTVYPTVTERWVSPDGSGQVTQRRAPAVTYDGALDPDAGSSASGSESTDTVRPGSRSSTASPPLPRDADLLTTRLLDASPPACELDGWAGYCLAEQVQEAFLTTVVPRSLAGAFWETLAEQPSVGLLGTTTDRAGRTGTAIAVDVPTVGGQAGDEEAMLVLIVSPEDGQLLATEELTLRSDALGIDEPTVTGFRAITSSAYTTSVGR